MILLSICFCAGRCEEKTDVVDGKIQVCLEVYFLKTNKKIENFSTTELPYTGENILFKYKLKGQNTGTDYSYKLIDEPCDVIIRKQNNEEVNEIIERGRYWITVIYNASAKNRDFGAAEFDFWIEII
jgi:hypothetical protein